MVWDAICAVNKTLLVFADESVKTNQKFIVVRLGMYFIYLNQGAVQSCKTDFPPGLYSNAWDRKHTKGQSELA